ncbi:hypothetical protein TUM20985_35590 [Mycobacterium antarcticum]|uniref:DUF4334 domain-containing protein n=1 Tax=unclassified Mycolicibacterium TaxID=2636767 RepID=UPI002389FDDC|nr:MULTISPECIES: DUF4334 domain-containing protein [unclassified Mycolicibacterium]BDX33012.1 hypothetical protein TUM20985_35590 [Mycolicibacterium sp. TUM20985]GLP76190.1 hypothetical protein TUM20983_33000 [Mycolicibacterium sp. TUM20983]GLP83430.1 hypothetical protein TUM20984_48500 [Mycolicibacterium sp. TUM20984]
MHLTDVLPDAPSTTDDALALFDAAPAVTPDEMLGTWRGAELPTGHPLDGLLEASGWWGKQFLGAETVHPLLFPTADGTALWAVNPALVFGGLGLATRLPALRRGNYTGLITKLKPVLRTAAPRARLRTTRYRGVDTATMVYDQLPVNDVFRRLDDAAGSDAVIGVMDLRGSKLPYFFVLRRDESLPVR